MGTGPPPAVPVVWGPGEGPLPAVVRGTGTGPVSTLLSAVVPAVVVPVPVPVLVLSVPAASTFLVAVPGGDVLGASSPLHHYTCPVEVSPVLSSQSIHGSNHVQSTSQG
jgi:hypothetical protein